jgi:uncharacterized repeat protein (TIGR04076 family)
MIKVTVQVHEVKGRCPIYKKDDTILFVKDEKEGSFYIDLEKTKLPKLCASTMGSLLTELIKVREGVRGEIFVHCIDPGPPYSNSGVVFKISRGENPQPAKKQQRQKEKKEE